MSPHGLSQKQIEERIAKGLQNTLPPSASKTNGQIFKENICTLFNLLNFLIAIALALVGAWSNLLFIAIILLNLVIGIAQELHAKKLVDELSLLIVPKATVIRDGQEVQILVEQVVQDDVMILDSGQQICCDSVIIEGESEVNENPIRSTRASAIICSPAAASSQVNASCVSSMSERRIMFPR